MFSSSNEIRSLSDYPDVLDVQQVSEILGFSTKTVYKLIKNGTLPSIKLGREFRISKLALVKNMQLQAA